MPGIVPPPRAVASGGARRAFDVSVSPFHGPVAPAAVSGTLVHLVAAWALIEVLGIALLLANMLAFLLANAVSFAANARLTFDAPIRWRRYSRFLGVSLSALAISTLIVWVAANLGIHYLFAIAASAMISAVLGYLLSRRWVFTERSGRP